jgi:DNA-binding LytR/AlgR family response regulator
MEKASPIWRRWTGGTAAAWGRILAASTVVAVIMAVSGGFGAGVLAVVPRALYWIGLCAVGTAIGIFAARTFVPREWFDHRPWAARCLVWLAIAAPMTVIVTVTTALIRGRPIGLAGLLDVLPAVWATTAGMTALAFLVRRHAPAETHAAEAGGPPAKFLARLPPNLDGADLWAVEAQDHYLRLHTSKGRALILLRLADAVAELEGIEGARTHRSWWVARAAVSGAVRADGRATLTLIDGSEAPVSRAYAAALRAAGWF